MTDMTNIGANIAELRKLRNTTQESLGAAVGVSTQAVSKWECGGTPDIALLPAIADFFGVSIDELCGHSKAVTNPARDMEIAVADYIASVMPQSGTGAGGVFHEMLRILSAAVRGVFGGSRDIIDMNLTFERTLESAEQFKNSKSELIYNEGMLTMPLYDGLHFAFVMEEPDEGLRERLKITDEMRALFAMLADPDGVKLVESIYSSNKGGGFSLGNLAKQSGVADETVRKYIGTLEMCRIVCKQKVMLDESEIEYYVLHSSTSMYVIAILALAVVQTNNCQSYVAGGCFNRSAPMLK